MPYGYRRLRFFANDLVKSVRVKSNRDTQSRGSSYLFGSKLAVREEAVEEKEFVSKRRSSVCGRVYRGRFSIPLAIPPWRTPVALVADPQSR